MYFVKARSTTLERCKKFSTAKDKINGSVLWTKSLIETTGLAAVWRLVEQVDESWTLGATT